MARGPPWITIGFFTFIIVWGYLLLSVLRNTGELKSLSNERFIKNNIVANSVAEETAEIETVSRTRPVVYAVKPLPIQQQTLPATIQPSSIDLNTPPSLVEVERNMTIYLQTLHSRLAEISGPKVTGERAWETFLDVTKNLPMKWDDENKHRQFTPREDGSIFVALGTYRDPFCPMTIKSLYSQAEHPENLFVGLFQQNCFEKVDANKHVNLQPMHPSIA